MKKNNCLAVGLMALFFLSSTKIIAQALNSEEIKTQLGKEWERSKLYTIDYLNTMPADKYSFKPTDSIRSFAQQMLHLAQGNILLLSTATGETPLAFEKSDLEHSPTAQNKDSVMYYVVASYDFCIKAVKGLDVNKWGEKLKTFGAEQTRFAILLKGIEHQAHHRGQTTIYIRLQGIKPPQERLF